MKLIKVSFLKKKDKFLIWTDEISSPVLIPLSISVEGDKLSSLLEQSEQSLLSTTLLEIQNQENDEQSDNS
mgnify:CR=1 FL=1